MSDSRENTIPAPLLAMLKQRWRVDKDGGTFERIFNGPAYEDRRADPSFYIHHKRYDENLSEMEQISYAEAKALLQAGVFGRLAVDHGSHISVNEHAEHAITDFCGEVYAAWARLQARLAEVDRVSGRGA